MFLWGDKGVTKVVENISEPRKLQIFGLILAAKNLDHNSNQILWVSFLRHVTQFTEVGWKYLLNGSGSGELPNGGYYATWVDPNSTHFTMNMVKISRAWH